MHTGTTSTEAELAGRVTRLERELRRSRVFTLALTILFGVTATTAFVRAPQVTDVIRAKQIIIEDAAGRDRIVLGAPMKDNFERVSQSTGMAIRDTLGNERFGLGLDARGNMGLGLDAPKCTSDPCNRERINLVADANGGSHIRFLDRKTGVAARMLLDDDDKVYLEFLKVTKDSIAWRRMALRGDTAYVQSRH